MTPGESLDQRLGALTREIKAYEATVLVLDQRVSALERMQLGPFTERLNDRIQALEKGEPIGWNRSAEERLQCDFVDRVHVEPAQVERWRRIESLATAICRDSIGISWPDLPAAEIVKSAQMGDLRRALEEGAAS
ncbi:MAG: hypothetical protein RIS45_1587 [Planctomycetota bacterium]|jgi:hypothetical protein